MRLADYLATKGISQAEMARRIGVSRWSISRYCAGDLPSRDKLERIAEATGGDVLPNDFCDLPDPPARKSKRRTPVR